MHIMLAINEIIWGMYVLIAFVLYLSGIIVISFSSAPTELKEDMSNLLLKKIPVFLIIIFGFGVSHMMRVTNNEIVDNSVNQAN